MAIQINPGEKKSSGGILEAIGTVAGLVAAPFTAGASLSTVAAGVGLGRTAGGLADKALGTDGSSAQSPGVGNAMSRRASQVSSAAEVKEPSKVLGESLQALNSPGVSQQVKDEAGPALEEAYALSKRMKLQGRF